MRGVPFEEDFDDSEEAQDAARYRRHRDRYTVILLNVKKEMRVIYGITDSEIDAAITEGK